MRACWSPDSSVRHRTAVGIDLCTVDLMFDAEDATQLADDRHLTVAVVLPSRTSWLLQTTLRCHDTLPVGWRKIVIYSTTEVIASLRSSSTR